MTVKMEDVTALAADLSKVFVVVGVLFAASLLYLMVSVSGAFLAQKHLPEFISAALVIPYFVVTIAVFVAMMNALREILDAAIGTTENGGNTE